MIKIITLLFILANFGIAQIGVKSSYKMAHETQTLDQAFLGNGVVDLIVKDSVIWAATGFGLNKSINAGASWQSFTSNDYMAKGGISAMAYMGDSVFWIASAFDTTAQDEDLPAGGGLSYTKDGGIIWTHVAQPLDAREDTTISPTTTVVQNLTFDITAVDSTIWIASFGGGLRRSDDMGQSWRVVTTDNKPF